MGAAVKRMAQRCGLHLLVGHNRFFSKETFTKEIMNNLSLAKKDGRISSIGRNPRVGTVPDEDA
jgi:hypothetical protein